MVDPTSALGTGIDKRQQQAKHGFKGGKQHGKGPSSSQSLNSDTAVPMLRFGVGNNYDLFKRKIFWPQLDLCHILIHFYASRALALGPGLLL